LKSGRRFAKISGTRMKIRTLNQASLALGAVVLIALFLTPTTALGQGSKYDGWIQIYCDKHGMDPKLIHSIIAAESGYDPGAISARGAAGLMQLMPETAVHYGVSNALDPKENIEAGVRYLKDLSRIYEDDLDRILAAYNAGPEALKKYSGIPPFPETTRYIRKVKALYSGQGGRFRTRIYRFRDSQGRMIMTNDKNYYLMNKSRTEPGSNS